MNIVSTLKEPGQSLYDVLLSGKSVPILNPSVPPLSSPIKSGSTIPVTPASFPTIIPSNNGHKALDTNATAVTTGVPISVKYKFIPA